MTGEELYKALLLDHARKPRNKGDLSDADQVCRGSNPRCGDEIDLGLYFEDGQLDRVKFRGRGCAICIASASMLTEVAGGSPESVLDLCDAMHDWFDPGAARDQAPCDELLALGPVRAHPARHRCALLCWDALRSSMNG